MLKTALKVLKQLSALLSLWIFFMPAAHASEPAFVRESLRARGMGNAFTAVANDEMLFFYNPAGLRSVIYNIYEIVGFNFTINENTLSMGNSSSKFSKLGDLAGTKLYVESNVRILKQDHLCRQGLLVEWHGVSLTINLMSALVPSLFKEQE